MKKFVAAGAFMLMLLTGCGSPAPDMETYNESSSSTDSGLDGFELDTPDGTAIQKVTIDGTECVVLTRYNAASVDCDWSNDVE